MSIDLGKNLEEIIKSQVRDRVAYYIALAKVKFQRDFKMPDISFELNSSRVAGLAYCSRNMIKFHLGMLLTNYKDFHEDTIGHEVAHIIQYNIWPKSKQHGLEWKLIMTLFGIVPTRCHDYDLVKAGIYREYVCNCDQRIRTFRKKKDIQKADNGQITCWGCQSILKPKE